MANNPIFDFLRQEENLRVALEIERQLPDLREFLKQQFWRDFDQTLISRFNQSGYTTYWCVRAKNLPLGKYNSCNIEPKFIPIDFQPFVLYACFQHGTPENKYILHYGLQWSQENKPALELPAFRTILQKSRDAGIIDKNPWWPVLRYLDPSLALESNEFLMQYGPSPEQTVNDLVDKFWNFFELIEPELRQVHDTFTKGK